jgi:hypothetical protein
VILGSVTEHLVDLLAAVHDLEPNSPNDGERYKKQLLAKKKAQKERGK